MAGVTDLLNRFGYIYEGSCNCDGFKTLKYRKGNYQFRLRANKGSFKIKHYGVTKTTWKPVEKAEELLNTIHAQPV